MYMKIFQSFGSLFFIKKYMYFSKEQIISIRAASAKSLTKLDLPNIEPPII